MDLTSLPVSDKWCSHVHLFICNKCCPLLAPTRPQCDYILTDSEVILLLSAELSLDRCCDQFKWFCNQNKTTSNFKIWNPGICSQYLCVIGAREVHFNLLSIACFWLPAWNFDYVMQSVEILELSNAIYWDFGAEERPLSLWMNESRLFDALNCQFSHSN